MRRFWPWLFIIPFAWFIGYLIAEDAIADGERAKEVCRTTDNPPPEMYCHLWEE